MRHLDLFAGIGGFSLASHALGFETAAFVEIDPFCQRVLDKNFPGVPIHDDITTITADGVERWGTIDLITGGYPCQPYSQAGNRRGAADDRALWPQMRRVIALAQPRWVVGENVVGHIRLGLDEVLADLDADGYAAWPIGLPAAAVGANHKRRRVWVLAHARRFGHWTPANTLRPGWARPLDDSWWTNEPGIPRMDDGVSAGVDRRRALGNAIVPQVAYEILRPLVTGEAA